MLPSTLGIYALSRHRGADCLSSIRGLQHTNSQLLSAPTKPNPNSGTLSSGHGRNSGHPSPLGSPRSGSHHFDCPIRSCATLSWELGSSLPAATARVLAWPLIRCFRILVLDLRTTTGLTCRTCVLGPIPGRTIVVRGYLEQSSHGAQSPWIYCLRRIPRRRHRTPETNPEAEAYLDVALGIELALASCPSGIDTLGFSQRSG